MSINYYNQLLARHEQNIWRKIMRRSIRDSHNPFELPEWEFKKIFRLSKEMVLFLCQELGSSLKPVNDTDGLPIHLKVLTCVRLLGDGSYQRPTGQDHTVCIGQTTVSKYLAEFTEAVIRILLPKWIFFPSTENQRQRVANGFQTKYMVPGIIGAIDCTHVAIFPPKKPHGVQYKNRKGFYSINTQLVCDVDGHILHINARYPGRVHDQFVFNYSNLKQELQRLHVGRIGSYFLIGDSGYALEPWMMTPVLNAFPDSPEDKYTQWHCRARNCVERVNGYLKGTFRCLGHDRVLHYDPEKASKIIYTCATLYNIMLHFRIPLEEVEHYDDISTDAFVEGQSSLVQAAEQKRQNIINSYFV